MSEILTPLVFQLGAGGIAGFIVGYAFKKLLKLLAIIVGLFVAALIYLAYAGIIEVHFDKLAEAISGLLGKAGQATGLLVAIISFLPFAGSFAAGLLIGWKMG